MPLAGAHPLRAPTAPDTGDYADGASERPGSAGSEDVAMRAAGESAYERDIGRSQPYRERVHPVPTATSVAVTRHGSF